MREDIRPGVACVGLLLLAVLGAGTVRAQISPGPLSKPHAALEGSLSCTKCHDGRKEDMPATCLACHKEIAWLVEQRRGYHAAERTTPCAQCHPEHAGRDFDQVSWPGGTPERFDHRKAGWTLEQSHADVACTDCHMSRYQKGQAAALAPKPGGRWTGLEGTCITCHDDAHKGQLSRDCATCHDAGKWTSAVRFDHADTRYPLTGAHDRVTCDQCHLAASLKLERATSGKPVARYRPLPHAQCSDCHADPHAKKFGGTCSTCHVTASWQRIDKDKFDHDRTRYPLKGLHARVTCAGCHDPAAPKGTNPRFARCGDCHTDAHAGTATLAGRPADCAACHGLAGFRPATYTVAQHAEARYPLEGQHREVACQACHARRPTGVPASVTGTAGVVLRPAASSCRSCHAEDHGTQLRARTDGGRCDACHTVKGWAPSTFTAAEHARLALPLDGRHREVSCEACHGPSRPGLPPLPPTSVLGKAGVALHLDRSDCAACHVDTHGGRFAAGGARARPEGCVACHDTRTFRPSTITAATHAAFAWPLEGAHRATSCVACHAELAQAAPQPSLLLARRPAPPVHYAVAHQRCTDCHTESPHGTQFDARRNGGACDACHSEQRFSPADRFDHDRDATFALQAAHARVPCAKCHATVTRPRGTPQVTWRPLSGKCESCHEGNRTGPGGS